jgi:hypothetical protein
MATLLAFLDCSANQNGMVFGGQVIPLTCVDQPRSTSECELQAFFSSAA